MPDGGDLFFEADASSLSGEAGDEAGSGSTGSGSNTGRAGSGSNAGRAGSGSGSGSAGTGSGFPLGGAGTGSGFPGGGAGTGSGFPGGGGNQPDPDVAACSPCAPVIGGAVGDVPACCTNDDECGVDLSGLGGPSECLPRNAPGEQTDQCPSIDTGMVVIPGCCRPNRQCGIVIMRTAPLGCIDPELIADVIQINVPNGQRQRCN